MEYIVRNLLGSGVESVGTVPLAAAGAVSSAAVRTGRPESEIAASLEQLGALVPRVSIPRGEDAPASCCAVRIEVA